MDPAVVWRKVLYFDQRFPDNFVPESFLCQMRTNVNVVHFTPGDVFYGVTAVVQQICRVALFAVLFEHLQDGLLLPWDIFFGLAVLGCPAYCWYSVVQRRTIAQVLEDLHRAAVFMAFGSSLAPIMATLTETISTDTVYAMAAGSLLLHLGCHDYSRGLRPQAEDGEPVSDDGMWAAIALNGALFGAVCLASRLSGVEPVMALSALAVGLFLLAPLLASWVQSRWPQLHVALTIAHQVIALVGCWQLSVFMAIFLACTLVIIGVVLPGHFIYCHQYRQSIHGPWDEAIIDEDD